MTEKTSTWINGATAPAVSPADVQPRANGHVTRPSAAPGLSKNTRVGLVVGAAAATTAVALNVIPDSWAWETVRLLGVGLVLLFLFVWAFRLPTERPRPAFVIWWLVLVSGVIFFRQGDIYANAAAYEGQFPAQVYSEILGWLLCVGAMLVLWAPVRRQFGLLFTGDYKWLTFFAMVCAASCAYAPRTMFGLAWAFKLSVVVLVLVLCSTQMHDFRDTVSFLKFSFWAYSLVVLLPVLLGILSGSPFDDEGRMSTIVNPDALSADAGTVCLLALTLYSRVKGEGMRKSALIIGTLALVVAILGGGKAGIVAGVLAAVLFFVLRGRFGSALGYVGMAILLAFGLALATPLGSYFTQYRESGQGATLTGRTLLWSAVMPEIRQKIIFGHGYLASTFVEFQVNAVQWGASHLHNGFVEVLYNNGLVGFILIIMINVVIVRNLVRVLRRVPSTSPVYRVAAGCFALYAHLFINGQFNASFGGRVRAPFILLLSLVLVSNKLFELSSRPDPEAQQAM